ncbi:MAG TPA: CHAD domain-containing protein [Rudaea sp.]|nr:CHAD domain-containing protein [Rudaea sp.]
MSDARTRPAHALFETATADAAEQLAAAELTDARVHAARKALKKARASLRLLRPALADADYRELNLALRDAGRCLAPLRDAKALADTAVAFGAHEQAGDHQAELARLAPLLEAGLAEARRGVEGPAARERCAGLVAACRERLAASGAHESEGTSIEALRRLYRKGRRAFAQAREARTADALHEWRKQVKYLHTAATALRDTGLHRLHKLAEHTDRIAEALGEDHDLCRLCALAARDTVVHDGARSALVERIERRREKLVHKALSEGERLFAQKPKHFAAQLGPKRDA